MSITSIVKHILESIACISTLDVSKTLFQFDFLIVSINSCSLNLLKERDFLNLRGTLTFLFLQKQSFKSLSDLKVHSSEHQKKLVYLI